MSETLSVLEQIYAEQRRCEKCETLLQYRKAPVRGRGDPRAVILVIGEGPGAEEDRDGEAFVGRAGQKLDELITAACQTSSVQASPADFYMINSVACRPCIKNELAGKLENRPPTGAELGNCREWLHRLIRARDPIAIILAGAVACSSVGVPGAIAKIRGRMCDISIPGVRTNLQYCAMPIYHPSFLLRNRDKPQYGAETLSDIVKVIERVSAYLRVAKGLSPVAAPV